MIGRIALIAAFVLNSIFLFAQKNNNLLKNPANYKAHSVVVKLKKTNVNLRTGQSPWEVIQQQIKVQEVRPVNKNDDNARVMDSQSGISRIYVVELDEQENTWESVQKLNKMDFVEYAELLPKNELLYIPNDPQANPNSGNQYHLTNINAYNGWNLEKGDTNIVIGIVDTGVDIDHPDLLPNIAFNYADPVNGVDDDSDGYIDNFMGWDIADNDNDPNTDGNGHGNIVTGVSSAKTDNGTGLAGVGFNTRFLPVKILENASGNLVSEYDGVLFAANQGCQVINLSWGGPWNYTQFGQDIINYVVQDRDAVVVSAAGNTPDEIDFYPASYNNVLSVTASDASDNFASWATYSYHVDIMAPGQSIYSANKTGGYGNGGNGTSYATPMVAGAAALVRSKYPDMDARQVMEQIRVHADDVYGTGSNNSYFGQIGKGRLNVWKALSDTLSPSIRISEFNYSGNYGSYIFPGDTIDIDVSFINYLSEAKNLEIMMDVADVNASSDAMKITSGSLDTYQTIDTPDGWKIIVGENLEPYARLLFKTESMADNYSDFEYFQMYTTPWFFDVQNGDLSLTITSDGDLGYDRDSLIWGNGFWSGFNKISDQMGIILSRGSSYLADNVISDYGLNTRDQDFKTVEYARMYNNSHSSLDARSTFEENDLIDRQGIRIEQKVLGWDNLADNDFLILEYRIVNVSDSTLDSLNLAMYTDWDIQNELTNRVEYDPQNGIAYAFDVNQNNLFAGVSLLTQGDTSFYAIDRDALNGHTVEFDSLFTDSLKIAYSKSDFAKVTAGNLSGGNNVASAMGLRNVVLPAGESKKTAIVLMAANTPEKLAILLNRARSYYNDYLNTPPFENIFYTCLGDSATVQFEGGESFEIYSDPAMNVLLDSGEVYKTGKLWKDTLFYTVRILDGIRQDIRTSKVEIRDPKADFDAYTDTLLISDETVDTITFFNSSLDGFSYSWDFDNGYFSSKENPKTQFETKGNYSVQLIIKNDIGCSDTIVKSLVATDRNEKPVIAGQLICNGESTNLQASNTINIRVYDSPKLNNVLFEGASYVTDKLMATTDFYVTNIDGNESLPVKVKVTVSKPRLSFAQSVDTLNLQDKYILKIENTSSYAEDFSWNIDNGSFTDDIVYFDYEESATFDISLIGTDSLNCRDTVMTNIAPAISGQTFVNDTLICINETITIRPSGGDLFYFYNDASLNNVIHKGKIFQTDAIRSDTTFYVTNVDNLLEGQEATLNVALKPLKAVIQLTPDSLDLSEGNVIQVEDLSEGASLSYWLLSGGAIDMQKSFEMDISDPGEYFFTLIAKNGENCKDTARASSIAYFITGIKDLSDEIHIYPNPAQSSINIYSQTSGWDHLELLDETGKVIYKDASFKYPVHETELNISDLPNGIYLVRLHTKEQIVISKVIIRH